VVDHSSRLLKPTNAAIDMLCPVWHLPDLTRDGRDDWYPSLQY